MSEHGNPQMERALNAEVDEAIEWFLAEAIGVSPGRLRELTMALLERYEVAKSKQICTRCGLLTGGNPLHACPWAK